MEQRYISNELTHFVGRKLRFENGEADEEKQFNLLLNIIKSGWITHPPHNIVGNGNMSITTGNPASSNNMINPCMVCFCDIPVADIELHANKYSKFGISFDKKFLIRQGANPVFYNSLGSAAVIKHFEELDDMAENKKDSESAEFTKAICEKIIAFNDEIKNKGYSKRSLDCIERGSFFDKMVPRLHSHFSGLNDIKTDKLRVFIFGYLLSYVKFFDEKLEDHHEENYYMEREWRVIGNVEFNIEDIDRVIIPKKFAKAFRSHIPNYFGQLTFM